VTYLLLAGKGKLRLGLRPAMHFRSHDAPSASRARRITNYPSTRPVRDHRSCGPARAAAHRSRSVDGIHVRPQGTSLIAIAPSATAVRVAGHFGVRYFRADLGEGVRTTRWHRPRGGTRFARSHRRGLSGRSWIAASCCWMPLRSSTDGTGGGTGAGRRSVLITPVSRSEDSPARVSGDEIRTVIAGTPGSRTGAATP